MFLLLFLITALCNTPILDAAKQYGRHNFHKKKITEQKTEIVQPFTRGQEENFLPEEELELDMETIYTVTHEPDTIPHTPLGAICLEIQEYCAYFIEHCMEGPLLSSQRESLTLFCNFLALLANLADGDSGIIRLNEYLSNIITLTKTLSAACHHDSIILNHAAEYPFITTLTAQLTTEGEKDIACIMHYTLRSPEAARQTLHALFAELKTYAHYKLHAILKTFQEDTNTLLHRAQNPELLEAETTTNPLEKQNLHSLGWLCRHAASTCLDLAQTVPSSPLLAHTTSLMNQVQLMLSTMALTYTHLGSNKVRSQDRNTLAQQYTHLIEHMNTIVPRRGTLSHIAYVQSLATTEERQMYVEAVFANKEKSTQLLEEFFPTFNDTLDYNLTQFSVTLTEQIIRILSTRYWLE